jgi:hypothetical protein
MLSWIEIGTRRIDQHSKVDTRGGSVDNLEEKLGVQDAKEMKPGG